MPLDPPTDAGRTVEGKGPRQALAAADEDDEDAEDEEPTADQLDAPSGGSCSAAMAAGNLFCCCCRGEPGTAESPSVLPPVVALRPEKTDECDVLRSI